MFFEIQWWIAPHENIKYKQENLNLQHWKINNLENLQEKMKEMELDEWKGVIY